MHKYYFVGCFGASGRRHQKHCHVIYTCLHTVKLIYSTRSLGVITRSLHNLIQELSYRQQIARQLRTQFVEGISVTLKSTLRVTQGHLKRNHWTDHTRLTTIRVIGHWISSWPWNVGQRSLKVIESGTIWKFGYGFLTFPTLTLTLTLGLGVKVIKWRRSMDHMRLSIGPSL